MTTSIGLHDRYQNYRIRNWQTRGERMSGMLPRWRTRQRRHLLVVIVAAGIAALFASGVLSAFDLGWAPLLCAVCGVIMAIAWTMLRIVTEGHDHAPTAALDEWEVAQRNSARSIGLAITQTLTAVPVFYLIFAGTFFPRADAFRTAYSGGAMAMATLLAGGCAPAMILAWTRSDPDPEP